MWRSSPQRSLQLSEQPISPTIVPCIHCMTRCEVASADLIHFLFSNLQKITPSALFSARIVFFFRLEITIAILILKASYLDYSRGYVANILQNIVKTPAAIKFLCCCMLPSFAYSAMTRYCYKRFFLARNLLWKNDAQLSSKDLYTMSSGNVIAGCEVTTNSIYSHTQVSGFNWCGTDAQVNEVRPWLHIQQKQFQKMSVQMFCILFCM